MRITDAEYRDYQRLKEAERSGQLLSTDVLRMIIRAYDYDPEKVGKHFLEVYTQRKKSDREA